MLKKLYCQCCIFGITVKNGEINLCLRFCFFLERPCKCIVGQATEACPLSYPQRKTDSKSARFDKEIAPILPWITIMKTFSFLYTVYHIWWCWKANVMRNNLMSLMVWYSGRWMKILEHHSKVNSRLCKLPLSQQPAVLQRSPWIDRLAIRILDFAIVSFFHDLGFFFILGKSVMIRGDSTSPARYSRMAIPLHTHFVLLYIAIVVHTVQ